MGKGVRVTEMVITRMMRRERGECGVGAATAGSVVQSGIRQRAGGISPLLIENGHRLGNYIVLKGK